jgi:hypothetical protein
MRVLKRHSDHDDAAVGDGDVVESERPDRRVVADEPTVEQDTVPSRPGFRDRFRRTETVPVTVPRGALRVRRTVTVPGRQIEPGAQRASWNLASIAAIAAGAALAVVGAVALVRTGINDTWFRPVEQVLDANHTPLLGAIEVGAGVVLVLLGIAGSRFLVAAAGIAGALLATAAAVEPEELSRELAIESWWAWVLAGAGVLLALVALYEPRPARQDAVIDVR